MHPGEPANPELHTRVLRELEEFPGRAGAAVRAVVELHQPYIQGGEPAPEWAPWQKPAPVKLVCYACSDNDGVLWPCGTITAIVGALSEPWSASSHPETTTEPQTQSIRSLAAVFEDGPAARPDLHMCYVTSAAHPHWPLTLPLLWNDPDTGRLTNYDYGHLGNGRYRVRSQTVMGW